MPKPNFEMPAEVTMVRVGLHIDGRFYSQTWALDKDLLNRATLKEMYSTLGEKFSDYVADEFFLGDTPNG